MDPATRSERARLAALTRHHPEASATVQAAERFHSSRWSEHIERLLNDAPPLSNEQKHRLAALFRGAVQ